MFFGKRFLKFWGGSILVRSFFETFWELGTHPVLLDTHITETVGELPPNHSGLVQGSQEDQII